MRPKKSLTYAILLVGSTTSVSAQLSQGQANTLETVSLVAMGLSGAALVGLTVMNYRDGSESVSKPEAASKLKSVQSYVTTQIEMGNTLPNETEVIDELEEAADHVEEGKYKKGMDELRDIEDKLGKEFD